MADLTVIAEFTIPPHNACRLGFDKGDPQWLGFQPAYDQSFGAGRIDTRYRASERHHFVRFSVESDEVLHRARHTVYREWEAGRKYNEDDIAARAYIPFVRDCITFARDVAQACGLKAPAWDDVLDSAWHDHWMSRVDFLPQELLDRLYRYNKDRVLESNLMSLGVIIPKKEKQP